jgi:hypothetical protein
VCTCVCACVCVCAGVCVCLSKGSESVQEWAMKGTNKEVGREEGRHTHTLPDSVPVDVCVAWRAGSQS